MLKRFRLFLACLMMLALPLQGLAAASMLFCGMGKVQPVQTQTASGHDHAAHMHSDAQGAQQAQDGKPGALPDAGHKCGVCAACCHGALIAGFTAPAVSPTLPQADIAEPFVLIHARAAVVPDKPPRQTRV